MPRRISDYPDAFTGWNFVSSIGSVISVAATALFLQIVYLQLVTGKAIFGYPWAVPQLFSDYFRILKDRTAPGLEWALHSPPKPHAFTSLPLQSMGIPGIASIDADAISIALSNYFELKAQAAAIIQNCAHTFDMKVTVSTTEFAQSQIPLCDFNPNDSLQKYPAITRTWKEFTACSKCYAVMCINCHYNALLLVTNCNIFLILSNIRKIISVLAKFGYKNSIFSLIIIIIISSLMFYLPDLFVLSYVGLSGTVGFFAPTFVLRTGHGSGSGSSNTGSGSGTGSGSNTDSGLGSGSGTKTENDYYINDENGRVRVEKHEYNSNGEKIGTKVYDFESVEKAKENGFTVNPNDDLGKVIHVLKPSNWTTYNNNILPVLSFAYLRPLLTILMPLLPLLTTIISSLAVMVDGYFGGLISILQGLLQAYRIYKLPSRIMRMWSLLVRIYNYVYTNKIVCSSIIVSVIAGTLLFFTPEICCDAPRAWGLYFQDSASPQMEALVELHDNIMYYLVAILFAVGWIQAAIIRNFQSSRSPISNKYLNHGTLIELIWTITPNIKANSWVKLPNSGEVLVISYTKL